MIIFLIASSHHYLLLCVMVQMWKGGLTWQLLHVSTPPNCRCGGNQFGGRQPQPSQLASAAEQHTSSASQLVLVWWRELSWCWVLENVDIKILLLYDVGGGVWGLVERRGSHWSHLHLTWWLHTAATPPPPPPPSALPPPPPHWFRKIGIKESGGSWTD